MSATEAEFRVETHGEVTLIEITRPPHNFFTLTLIAGIADTLEALDNDESCRAIVLAAAGKSFCAGADFSQANPAGAMLRRPGRPPQPHLYKEAIRLFRTRKPIIAAVQGAAVGGGLGLACSADFRVTCPEASFWANFSKLGFHQGFGLSVTLPRLVGPQKAALLLYTSRKVRGEEAAQIGLADLCVPQDQLREQALALAHEIAANAPLAVMSMRETLRRGFADEVERATERELVEQDWQRQTEDFKEGPAALAERRAPIFRGL